MKIARSRTTRAALFVIGGTLAVGSIAQPQEPDESKERLIRKSQGEREPDLMERIILTMDDVEGRLGAKFDAGEKTQALQEQILKDLDRAIEQARKNMRRGQRSNQPNPQKRGEGETSDNEGESADQAGSGAKPTPGEVDDPRDAADPDGTLRERRRQWGNLPPREREEILQGLNEESDEEFREQIERYYEALSRPE